jgi:PAS domain S-box-containing protein
MDNNELTKGQLLQELAKLRERVAELELAAAARNHAEARALAILKAIPDLMFRLSKDGTHLDYYASHIDELFVQPEAFLGKHVEEVLPAVVAAEYMIAIQQVLDSGHMQMFDYSLNFEGIGHVHYEARMVRVGDDEVVVMVRNITERKRTEATLRFQSQLLDAAAQAIIATDLDGKITYWNRFAETLYGWTSSEALGRDIVDITPPGAGQELASEIFGRLAEGESWSGEFLVQRKDGTTFPAFVIDGPIYDNAGNVIGIIGVSTDLTDRIQAEQQRLELRMEREQTKIISNFIARASHEFRTPLSVIASSAYLLKKVSDPDRKSSQIERIEHQIENIARLVNELTMMAKLDGIRELYKQDIDLWQIIEAACEDQAKVLQSKSLHISLEPKAQPLLIRGNREYMQHAFEAVIDNAIRFTPEGGTITVRADSQDNNVIVDISDTGEGISDSDIRHIFERFYRADKAGTTRGFGLGLSIAKKVIDLHDGAIDVESNMGQGSTFRITLPRA